jgi:hypothetical protein
MSDNRYDLDNPLPLAATSNNLARRTAKKDGGKRKTGMFLSRQLSLHDAASLLICSPDPNAPKRGLSAYMFFANETRGRVREDNPGITFGEFSISHSNILQMINNIDRRCCQSCR